jgi:2-phospho-L-lactate guanylyltransferase
MWSVVLPLKATRRGKSRIEVDPALRQRLTLAMAMDTAAAVAGAAAVADVLVVVEDEADGREIGRLPGVRVLLTRTRDLNDAIADGLVALGLDRSAAARARSRHEGAGASGSGPVATLPADLPSLTADELDAALAACLPHRVAVVADRQGTGTTLLAATSPELLVPQYGVGSLARHVAAGAVPIELPADSGLRRDVDLADDLAGVAGRRTVAVLGGTAASLCDARGTA